ncbi:unnamed protein product [Moneuplotes crassus]|uniref:Uncharacterized protein n=2 Tax=Euplotes crassus TaxID=5936 RepID=A0AAD1XLH0_EUPCR|nr:unnamed protein product [Moneuplotes crassus]
MATPKRQDNLSVNDSLYQDAERRRQRQQDHLRTSKSKEKQKYQQQRERPSNRSRKILIKKYLIEFDGISQKLGVGGDPESPIHYTQYIMLMQQLGLVSDQNETDLDKLKMVWGIIQDQNSDQDTGHYCRKHSLKVICAAICGFKTKWMFRDYTRGQNVKAKAPKRSVIDLNGDQSGIKLDIGCFIEGLFFLNHKEECGYVQRLFSSLYTNRIIKKEERKQRNPENNSCSKPNRKLSQVNKSKPKINKNSYYLTNSHDSNCSVEDRLLNKQKEYDERRKSKREETQEVQFKECTFTPSLKKKTVAQHSQADINDMKKKLQASAYDVLLREESKSSQISLDQTRTDHKESQPRQEVEISQISGISNTKESFSNHPEEKFQEQPSAQKPLSHTSDFPAEDPEEDRYDEEAKELGSYLQENSLEEVHKDENVDLTPQKNAFSPDDVQSGTDNEPLELPRTTPEQEYSHEYEEEEDSEENYPILFLDVNLGKDKVERLVIFDGDDPQTVAEEFCQKNGLEEKKRKKLAKVIKKQLDSLLTRIDEDEDEEESRD